MSMTYPNSVQAYDIPDSLQVGQHAGLSCKAYERDALPHTTTIL